MADHDDFFPRAAISMRLIFRLIRLRIRLAVLIIVFAGPVVRTGPAADVLSRVSTGGIGRYTAGRWGLVQGFFSNATDEDQVVTAVVTPRGRSGAQFVRSLTIPPQTRRRSVWPVLVEHTRESTFAFDVLIVRGAQDSSRISKLNTGESTDDFISSNQGKAEFNRAPTGYCGLLSTRTESPRDEIIIDDLILRLRSQADLKPMTANIVPTDIGSYAEALEPLDQLIISSPDLPNYPETCDAVRLWIQRGGRALILLDQCGEESASAILGDALPLTVVDRTSSLRVPLKHDAAELLPGAADDSHLREFAEPITMVRAVFEAGQVLWSVRGWPALVEVPFGDGAVFVSTLSPEVLLSEQGSGKLDAVATPILELMFRTRHERPLLSAGQLASASERRIGYMIPQRGFAGVVLLLFTLALGFVARAAWKREQPGLLMLAIPLLSMMAAAPGLVIGKLSRGVAPSTLIEGRVANLVPGQATIAADGVSTVYQPAVVTSELWFADGTLLSNAHVDSGPQQRLVWSDTGTSRWVELSQPVGATSYDERSVFRLPEPLRAQVDFQKDGLLITLANTDLLRPEDMLLVGSGADRMTPQSLGDGLYACGPQQVLATGQVSSETLLSETQILHADLYRAIFSDKERLRRFPPDPSVMFWSHHLPPAVRCTDDSLRRESMTLMTVPVEFNMPAVNEPITIPTVLLRCRAIKDVDGGVSAAYSNSQARWIPKTAGSRTLLQFTVPSVCRPFHFDDAELQLRILAGSRTVNVHSGTPDQLVQVTSLPSPVGNFTVTIPRSVLNTDGSSVLVCIEVGDLPGTVAGNPINADQDDFWKIERVLLTVRGHRMSVQTSSAETAPDE